MCKILINEVMLGKRNVGFECYSVETGEIVGYTEKQIKHSFKLEILCWVLCWMRMDS